ncbi:MAG: hypothetical protein H8E42_10665 [Nitrospinae bacterium]|nr:hypothetical protein [Nitrospinota bacterium]MBL7020008.1 hypothetical protein [Nitrospinaceae bacterium]
MLYDVKIMNSQGKIKKIVSAQELSKSFWNKFQDEESNKTLNTSGRKQVPGWVKKRLDMEYTFPRDTFTPAA